MINPKAEILAAYQYDAYGKIADQAGPQAEENAWRFSTKPLEEATGWNYYGFRYYDAEIGRWPSRDPIEENGGANLYGFVGNNGIGTWDKLGLKRVNGALIGKALTRDKHDSCCLRLEKSWQSNYPSELHCIDACIKKYFGGPLNTLTGMGLGIGGAAAGGAVGTGASIAGTGLAGWALGVPFGCKYQCSRDECTSIGSPSSIGQRGIGGSPFFKEL